MIWTRLPGRYCASSLYMHGIAAYKRRSVVSGLALAAGCNRPHLVIWTRRPVLSRLVIAYVCSLQAWRHRPQFVIWTRRPILSTLVIAYVWNLHRGCHRPHLVIWTRRPVPSRLVMAILYEAYTDEAGRHRPQLVIWTQRPVLSDDVGLNVLRCRAETLRTKSYCLGWPL